VRYLYKICPNLRETLFLWNEVGMFSIGRPPCVLRLHLCFCGDESLLGSLTALLLFRPVPRRGVLSDQVPGQHHPAHQDQVYDGRCPAKAMSQTEQTKLIK
jgi:hypothetical protein